MTLLASQNRISQTANQFETFSPIFQSTLNRPQVSIRARRRAHVNAAPFKVERKTTSSCRMREQASLRLHSGLVTSSAFKLQRDAVAVPLEPAVEKPVDTIRVKQFYEILNLHSQSHAPTKTGRISYSRDFLIRLASSPMAKTKPDFLPEHPVVLEKARDQDLHKLFVNNLNNKMDMVS